MRKRLRLPSSSSPPRTLKDREVAVLLLRLEDVDRVVRQEGLGPVQRVACYCGPITARLGSGSSDPACRAPIASLSITLLREILSATRPWRAPRGQRPRRLSGQEEGA